jgi:hypothetical protein
MSERKTIDLGPGEYRRLGERLKTVGLEWWRITLGLVLGLPLLCMGWRLTTFEFNELYTAGNFSDGVAWAGIVWLTAGLVLTGTAVGGVVRRVTGRSG